ncbi:MAG: DUF6506 family protein [Anaerovoracaceae bacterium]|nr:DUF6506 family protein [Bacillota bacterium]MDY2670925.1 DUF6506 family protein [Anaerovoracaceae bacterium]
MFNCGFIFITEGCDPSKDHVFIPSDSGVAMQVVGVSNYDEAEEAARTLAEAGANCIELCPGFGIEGAARVKKAAPGVAIGVCRFDYHVAMDNKSPDDLF